MNLHLSTCRFSILPACCFSIMSLKIVMHSFFGEVSGMGLDFRNFMRFIHFLRVLHSHLILLFLLIFIWLPLLSSKETIFRRCEYADLKLYERSYFKLRYFRNSIEFTGVDCLGLFLISCLSWGTSKLSVHCKSEKHGKIWVLLLVARRWSARILKSSQLSLSLGTDSIFIQPKAQEQR